MTETDAGLAALEAAGLPFSDVEVRRAYFHGRILGYSIALIRMKPPARTLGPLLRDVPIPGLSTREKAEVFMTACQHGATATLSDRSLQLTTFEAQGSYSLTEELRTKLKSVHGAVILHVRLQVEEEEDRDRRFNNGPYWQPNSRDRRRGPAGSAGG